MNWTLGLAAAASRRLRKVFSATGYSLMRCASFKAFVRLTRAAAVSQEGDDCGLSIPRDCDLGCRGRLFAHLWGLIGFDVGWRHP